MKFKTFLFLAACGGGVWYYYHDKEATPAPTKEDAPITETQTVACDIKPAIPVEQAMDMLVRYGIMDTSPSSRVKKQSDEIQYHFMMYKDGMEDIKAYPYIDAIISMYGSLKDKKLPIKCLEAFCAKGCVIQDVAMCCAAAFRMPDKDDELLTFILEQGIKANTHSINSTDKDGWTPIMYATHCYENSEMCRKIFETLIELGADVNQKNRDGWNALTIAFHNQTLIPAKDGVYNRVNMSPSIYETVISTLLDAGAQVNGTTKNGMTPLMMTLNNKGGLDVEACERMVYNLLERGADVNLADSRGYTPLIYTVDNAGKLPSSTCENIANKLLQMGANPNVRDNGKKLPLVWLMEATLKGGRVSVDVSKNLIIELLNRGTVIEISDLIEECIPLHYASQYPENVRDTIVNAIVDNFVKNAPTSGVKLGAIDETGWTILMHVMGSRCSKYSTRGELFSKNTYEIRHIIADALIKAGAKVDAKNSDGMTALSIVMRNYSHIPTSSVEKLVKTLVEAGADVNSVDNEGKTPLIHLYDICTEITPLYSPKSYHCPDGECLRITDFMVQSGANINTTDNKGKYVIDYALEHEENTKEVSLIEKLISLGLNASSWKRFDNWKAELAPTTEPWRYEWREAVKRVLANGHSVASSTVGTATTYTNNSLDELDSLIKDLTSTQYYSDVEKLYQRRLLTILSMIKSGEPVDIVLPNMNGTTALHNACGLSRADIVQWLVNHGADLNAKTSKGASVEDCVGGYNATAISEILRNARNSKQNVSAGQAEAEQERSGLDPLIARMQALRCREESSKLYQKRLLMLLPMIRNGADVNVTTPETKGNTALHYACGIGSWGITQWLVAHGADVNAVTNAGKTPLDCVGDDNAQRIRELLISRGAKHSAELSHDGGSETPEGMDAEELNNIGLAYQYGNNGKPQNYSEAARHFRLAAEQGHAGAQNNLGFCYHNGWGVPKDMSQAAMWYKRSADQENAWGQSNYGTCLEFGWGVRKSVSAAIEMYRRAAAQGHASAKKHLKRHGITM